MEAAAAYLITGGAGFLGSHLADALLARGHRVDVIDDLSTGSLANIAHLLEHPAFHFVHASITDSTVLNRLSARAAVVLHLAAAVGVKLIVDRPVETIQTNVGGTEAVLKAARRYNCQVVLASTSEVYGKGTGMPLREDDDVLFGATTTSRWAYGASKMVDEFLALAYHREYGLRVTVTRLFNIVGPRQTGRYGMVVPRFIRQALCNEPITVYGNGSQSRCFCDVRDVIRAIIGLARHPATFGQVYNIGSTEEIRIGELAERIKAMAGSTSPIVLVPYDQAYDTDFEEMHRRVPDTTRIASLLGWRPSCSLDESLHTVMEYERHRIASDRCP